MGIDNVINIVVFNIVEKKKNSKGSVYTVKTALV